MERMNRIYRGKQWADDERHGPARRVAQGVGLLLAVALIVIVLLAVLGAA